MFKCFAGVALVWLMGQSLVSAAEPTSEPAIARAGKIRVLVVTGGHGFEHEPFFSTFSGHPDIVWREVIQPEASKWYVGDKVKEYDVLVWYDWWQTITDEEKANLTALLKGGKPLVALHHCICDYQDWPEGLNIIGGRYWEPNGAHPSSFHQGNKYLTHIADPQHPITRFMQDYEVVDETYNNVEILPSVKPLITCEHPQSNKVIGWTHMYGKGRVAYIQPGHGPELFADKNHRRLIAQTIRWAAGALPDPSEEGFVPLFNGKDLDGWQVMGDPKGFEVKDGVIRCESSKPGGQWMRTLKEYKDFILRVEWRVGDKGNSGVFIRAMKEGSPWLTGYEVQISNEPRDPAHCSGALYGYVPVDPMPDETADKWHEFQIECRGHRIKVFEDGIPIIDVDEQSVPALQNKPRTGFIGIQDSHNPQGYIEYRKIAVKELKMDAVASKEPVWRLGSQAYTFRLFTFFEAVDKLKALGLKYIEAYPGQKLSAETGGALFGDQMPTDVREKVLAKLKEAGVKLVNYGVVHLTKDEAETRKIFDFAKAMGIETLTAEPEPDAFDLLEKLTAEYGVNVAIHNHPKPSRYWNPQTVLDAIKGHGPRIGACADTGHWPRSGLDPVESLKKLDGHIISLHFKDLNERSGGAHDVVWGSGSSDVKGMLTELHRQGFSGVFSVEYEHNWTNSMPDIAESIKYFKKVAAESGQKVE